jgi:hypothetical protein
MGTKQNPAAFDCYGSALPDEPMFILLARDPNAPSLVRSWADRREQDILDGIRPVSDIPMVQEARHCADAMTVWRREANEKWRSPAPQQEGDSL